MLRTLVVIFFTLGFNTTTLAKSLKVGDLAPNFVLKTDKNTDFELHQRKGKWTILFFFPKAETPGCTKQACAFRDAIKVIRQENADVFGISADDVGAQAQFVKNHQLSFTLLADPELKAIELFDTKMPLVKMSKRWTFLINPDLKIAFIDQNVDPVKDANKMAEKIRELTKNR